MPQWERIDAETGLGTFAETTRQALDGILARAGDRKVCCAVVAVGDVVEGGVRWLAAVDFAAEDADLPKAVFLRGLATRLLEAAARAEDGAT